MADMDANIDNLPAKMAGTVRSILRATPEYETARREGRAMVWLDSESVSIGFALAEVVKTRLDDLDA